MIVSATVGFSDVTSANIVGFMNKTLVFGGKMMVCPAFENVSGSGATLNDLAFTGYENLQFYKNYKRTTGFTVDFLNKNGVSTNKYNWVDTYASGVWAGGKWQNNGSKKYVGEDGEPIPTLVNGEALYVTAPNRQNNAPGYYLISSGQVITEAQSIPLNFGAKKAVGNMFAVPIPMTKITMSGYEDLQFYKNYKRTTGFTVDFLNKNGVSTNKYNWVDTYASGVWAGGKWQNNGSKKYVGEDEPDFMVDPGTALWVTAPNRQNNAPAYYLNFKKPEALNSL